MDESGSLFVYCSFPIRVVSGVPGDSMVRWCDGLAWCAAWLQKSRLGSDSPEAESCRFTRFAIGRNLHVMMQRLAAAGF
jgi:hypothetical protein